MNRKLKIATAPRRFARKWVNRETTWDELKDRLSTTVRTSESVDEYKAMSPSERAGAKDSGGFVGGHLEDGLRRRGHVTARSLVALDLDTPPVGVDKIIAATFDHAWLAYTTHSHTPSSPRWRLVIPLSRDVDADEYDAVARMIASRVGIDFFDDSTYQPHRLMYWPSTPSDGQFLSKTGNSDEFLDPDQVLAAYADWSDVTSRPHSSRTTCQPSNNRQVEDPLSKPGLIGAFCRAYPLEEAIETFLSEVYDPAGGGRYAFKESGSSAGAKILEGGHFYSHHSTDPACGHLQNAFDLVRIHLYGNLDEETGEETPINKRPSYLRMCDLAARDERVKTEVFKERQKTISQEFTPILPGNTGGDGSGNNGGPSTPTGEGESDPNDWMNQLTLNRKGAVVPCLENARIIVENDPNLSSIAYNQLSKNIEIAGSLPWHTDGKYWRDTDDVQLAFYIEQNYGHFPDSTLIKAVQKVSDDRSFHPIIDYLESLPAWDGQTRVDTLLVDYLGADDNIYVRAVSRKTLCAAVARVFHPGCKFDNILVLEGPQGVGKSTLIARLAGQWFSDSLHLADTKDKTAAEKLQGYWILEIGELAGMYKAEVETLRSFISRQEDIYRPSYGKRAIPHPRQCVFFATTNDSDGYLRDVTGNRRFWPVHTPGNPDRHSWDITQDLVDQIWAEAVSYYRQGETLFLDERLETLALAQQRLALEHDEREGVVKRYLETWLPGDWDSKNLFERRAYMGNLTDEDFAPINPAVAGEATTPRWQVSTMEIWCECFGREQSQIRRSDSRAIIAILTKLGWVKAEKKVRLPLYGPQHVFEQVVDASCFYPETDSGPMPVGDPSASAQSDFSGNQEQEISTDKSSSKE